MLWVKALHLIFMVTWFAGLFYLPRLFVYHATVTNPEEQARFAVMERRLFVIMTAGGLLTMLFGLWLLLGWRLALLETGWMRAKLALLVALTGYHVWCRQLMGELGQGKPREPRWYRWFNEAPAVFLVAIVLLAVVRPF